MIRNINPKCLWHQSKMLFSILPLALLHFEKLICIMVYYHLRFDLYMEALKSFKYLGSLWVLSALESIKRWHPFFFLLLGLGWSGIKQHWLILKLNVKKRWDKVNNVESPNYTPTITSLRNMNMAFVSNNVFFFNCLCIFPGPCWKNVIFLKTE